SPEGDVGERMRLLGQGGRKRVSGDARVRRPRRGCLQDILRIGACRRLLLRDYRAIADGVSSSGDVCQRETGRNCNHQNEEHDLLHWHSGENSRLTSSSRELENSSTYRREYAESSATAQAPRLWPGR